MVVIEEIKEIWRDLGRFRRLVWRYTNLPNLSKSLQISPISRYDCDCDQEGE
jgi:hypothetical protein